MCPCGRALRRWAGAFTRAESLLLPLAGALLAALLALLVLLPLHLQACRPSPSGTAATRPTPLVGGPYKPTTVESKRKSTRCTATGWETLVPPVTESQISTRCTAIGPAVTENSTETPENPTRTTGVLASEPPDGEPLDEREYGFVLALVKVTPSGTTFGCVLSMLTPHWTITAASCIDAIEEVDSLDSFVVMEGSGRAVAVGGVRVHPRYAAGAGVDLALLRAAERLRGRPARLLPSLDFHRFTVGERLMLLGFGKFRSVEAGGARRLRAAGVVRLPAAACAGAGGDGGAPRHLRPVADARAARCAETPLCTGVLFARAQPCQYCAGAALVWRGALAGVLGEGEGGCGAACAPAPVPRLSAHRAWLRAALADHEHHL